MGKGQKTREPPALSSAAGPMARRGARAAAILPGRERPCPPSLRRLDARLGAAPRVVEPDGLPEVHLRAGPRAGGAARAAAGRDPRGRLLGAGTPREPVL